MRVDASKRSYIESIGFVAAVVSAEGYNEEQAIDDPFRSIGHLASKVGCLVLREVSPYAWSMQRSPRPVTLEVVYIRIGIAW